MPKTRTTMQGYPGKQAQRETQRKTYLERDLMKYIFPQPKLVAAAAMLTLSQMAVAQTATLPSTDAGSVNANPAETPAPSLRSPSDASFLDRTFGDNNPSSAANQLSLTPGYELGGIGRRNASTEERILTAPAQGLPLRFDNGVFVYPSAVVGFGRNSNVLGTNTNQVSSSLVSLQPGVVAELKSRGDRYTLAYRGNYTRYASSGDDNFNHHDIGLAGDNYLDSRSRVGWSAGYVNRTDPRGSTDRAISTEPDRWNSQSARGIYIYGTPGAAGRVEVEGGLTRKRYENNRTTTIASDLDQVGVSGRFFYRVMPRTSLVVELRQTRNDYILDTSSNDNVDTRVLTGVTWDATAKTSGSVKAGYLYKKYSAAGHQNASGFTFEGSARWSPLTYSTVDLLASRSAADSTGLGAFITNTAATSQWNHRWSSQMTSRVSLGTVKSEFAGAGRVDNTNNLGAGLFYDVGRSLRGGVELTRVDRSSNQSIYDFKRNTVFLSVEGSL